MDRVLFLFVPVPSHYVKLLFTGLDLPASQYFSYIDVWPTLFPLNVFTALNGTHLYIFICVCIQIYVGQHRNQVYKQL